jgi:DNA anti-recombination protein RmuC
MEVSAAAAVIGIVLAILGNVVAIAYMSGRLNNRVDNLQRSLNDLQTDYKSMLREQNDMGQRLARMEGHRRTNRENT